MARAKRGLVAMLGWVVWKLLAVFGVKYAKDRLSRSESDAGHSRRR